MASILEREFSFCDWGQNNLTISALYDQKQSSTFCDVMMKVCGREIFAHSNILAAASPYFSSFLSQDLPRQFSQRSPQVIEIQIDGSEPNVYFEEAVASVVDFIYTGKLLITQSNVSQICEIGRIMQIDSVVKFCSDFQESKTDSTDTVRGNVEVQTFEGELLEKKRFVEFGTMTESWETDSHGENIVTLSGQSLKSKIIPKVGDPAFHAKIKAKQLVSVSCQIYPHLLPEMAKDNANVQDQATSTDNRYFETLKQLSQLASKGATRGRKRKVKDDNRREVQRYKLIHTEAGDMILSAETGELIEQDQEDNQQVVLITEGTEENNAFIQHADESMNAKEQAAQVMVDNAKENESTSKNDEDHNSYAIPVMDVASYPESERTNIKVASIMFDNISKERFSTVTHYVDEVTTDKDDAEVASKNSPRRSRRVSKPSARLQEFQEFQELQGPQLKKIKQEIIGVIPEYMLSTGVVEIIPVEGMESSENIVCEESIVETFVDNEMIVKHERTEEEEAAVRLLSLADEIVQKEQMQEVFEDDEDQGDDAHKITIEVPKLIQSKYRREDMRRKNVRKVASNIIQIGPGKYQCETCSFNTNRVRQMSAHIKLHKLENNTCYYCENTFSCKEDLAAHMGEHKGPVPFFCHVCSMRFKSRTLLNMHLPKHSDSKPFICHVCSMGFKWKHALKCHMITHTNKKEHLCDICGYATAHKTQLKAHRKIHSGDTLKCHYPDCNFLATKTQNMKYHLLTHTKEKPHQCDMCGQNFSLVKNLRRHLMLHSTDKKQTCIHCTFTSTRLDKLKEHLLKMHGVGTPPERRMRVTDQVNRLLNSSKTGHVHGQLSEVNQELLKVETQLIMATDDLEVKDEPTSTRQMTQMTHHLSGQADDGEATLIEIIHENGTPMHIFRNQSILITHPSGHDRTAILEQIEGSVQEFSEVVQIGSAVTQGLVLTEPVDGIAQDSTSVIHGEATLTEALDSEGMVSGQVVSAVPECLEIQGLDGQVTYAEMVEVPMDHASVQ